MVDLNRKNGVVQLGNYTVEEIAKKFGTPLYLYDEKIIRERCQQLKGLCTLPNFHINYSAKANSSIAVLKIIREEGILVDAMSLGEILQEQLAGYPNDEILFLSNNVSRETFQEVIRQGIKVCVDSLVQLESYCSIAQKGEVYIRVNPGQGDGHHEKVITAGKVKFGIDWSAVPEAHEIVKKYGMKITGFTMHIGSLFLKPNVFHGAVQELLDLAKSYPDINYIDFGGGLGIPYDRTIEDAFPLEQYSKTLTQTLESWMRETGRTPIFGIEPGRFLVGEAGVCLTPVESTKTNQGIRFVGTTLGFNFLLRPEFYGSYHEIINATNGNQEETEVVTVVGNICESGDILGKDRTLPKCSVGDLLLVRDTGAYGFSMASNYNSHPRPAEVLIQEDGELRLIRKREVLDDLVRNQIY